MNRERRLARLQALVASAATFPGAQGDAADTVLEARGKRLDSKVRAGKIKAMRSKVFDEGRDPAQRRLDSTTVAAIARADASSPCAHHFRYGQRHVLELDERRRASPRPWASRATSGGVTTCASSAARR